MQVCVKKKPGINPHTCLLQALSSTNSLLQQPQLVKNPKDHHHLGLAAQDDLISQRPKTTSAFIG
jgi:hypothetical protein